MDTTRQDNNGLARPAAARLLAAQVAYAQADARFTVARARRAELLGPHEAADFDRRGEEALAIRRQINRVTRYWEAYDARYAAGTALLRAARAWATVQPVSEAAIPWYRALRPGLVSTAHRDTLIALAMAIETL